MGLAGETGKKPAGGNQISTVTFAHAATMELHERGRRLIEKRLREAKELQREFRKQLLTTLSASFALVAALFWQSALKSTITAFIPPSGVWMYEIITAMIVTIIAVIAIYYISKLSREPEQKNK